jgi:uncharacterized membrane protein (DUF106 family)
MISTEKGLVQRLRKIRDKLNQEIINMTLEEEKAYLKKLRKSNSK